MKKIKQSLLTIGLFLCATLPAFAQPGAREDNSMLLTYLFLGTCALIILLQFAPLMAILFGIVKGIFGKKPQEEVKTAPAKIR
ncbi:MAG: hypothetical protein K0A94_06560 [Desulfuromonadales bacterium]|nr:hypothetical protein [Desulfuromonadales bacterium]